MSTWQKNAGISSFSRKWKKMRAWDFYTTRKLDTQCASRRAGSSRVTRRCTPIRIDIINCRGEKNVQYNFAEGATIDSE